MQLPDFLVHFNTAVFSSGFSAISPSNNEPCLNAYIGQLPASSCSWHAQSGSVRLQLSAGALRSVLYEAPPCQLLSFVQALCSMCLQFVQYHRPFRTALRMFLSCVISLHFAPQIIVVRCLLQVLSNRTFRSSEFVDSSWFSVSKQ